MRETNSAGVAGWISVACALLGLLLPLSFASLVDASSGKPAYPWPNGGWRLPDMAVIVAAFLLTQCAGLATGVLARSSKLGRFGIYSSVSALLFCLVRLAFFTTGG